MKVCPPAVSVALRVVPAVFAATLYPMVPSPDPEPPLVMVSHDWLLVAVHVQPVDAVIATVDDPPLAVGEADPGDNE